MNLYLDIETIGSEDPAVIAEIAAGILPPKTMSKPETIAKWEAEDKPALVDEAVRRTSFDGGLGRVVCIAYAIDDAEPCMLHDENECDLLRMAVPAVPNTALVIGHNIGWDLRFLWQRHVVNNMRPPAWLSKAVRAKPWDLADTMAMWNPERDRKVSLDKLCRILGVTSPKGAMDGSKVWDVWRNGSRDSIAEYCAGDVKAMRECYRRLTA